MGDAVYVLGTLGDDPFDTKQVLARVPMSSLLGFDFSAWRFWCGELRGWTRDESCVETILHGGQTETTLHYNAAHGVWIVPMVPLSDTPRLTVHTAPHATGPWTAHEVSELPSLGVNWTFRT